MKDGLVRGGKAVHQCFSIMPLSIVFLFQQPNFLVYYNHCANIALVTPFICLLDIFTKQIHMDSVKTSVDELYIFSPTGRLKIVFVACKIINERSFSVVYKSLFIESRTGLKPM